MGNETSHYDTCLKTVSCNKPHIVTLIFKTVSDNKPKTVTLTLRQSQVTNLTL